MQSHLLKTFTANFDPEEDRIRLDCDLHVEEQAQIFFTQRLGKLFVLELAKRVEHCLLYTSPSPRDLSTSRMPSSA